MITSDPVDDPYQAPRAVAPEFPAHDSRKWRVEDGSLWVQDGAELPPVCLYGSQSKYPVVSGWLTLVWLSPLAQRIVITGEVCALVLMFTLALRGVYGALTFAGITMAAAILMGLLPLLFLGWKKHRRRLKIFRVLGRRRFLRTWAFSLAVFGAYVAAISMMVHFTGVWKIGQYQQIGLSNTLMMTMIMVQTSGRILLQPHVVEAEGPWFRLASIHPRAIDEFARIQGEERSPCVSTAEPGGA